MNINDYIYIMSFYLSHDMQDRAGDLKERFTARPAGMFLKEFDNFPNWSVFSGYNNALAFSLIQNVSHTQILMYSDMALLMMRFAEITAPDASYVGGVAGRLAYHSNYKVTNLSNSGKVACPIAERLLN